MPLKLPACSYGAKCYRKNPKHFEEYSHPDTGPAAAAVTTKKKKAVVLVVDDDKTDEDVDDEEEEQKVMTVVASQKRKQAAKVSGGGAKVEVKEAAKKTTVVSVAEEDEDEDEDEEDEGGEEEGEHDTNGADDADDFDQSLPKPKKVMKDGDVIEVSNSSGSSKYKIKRTMDHYYCTCPAWRNQSGAPTNGRTCKHLKEILGEEYERARCELANPPADDEPKAGKRKAKDPAPASPAKKQKKGEGAADEEEDEGDADADEIDIPLPKPKKVMEDGEVVEAESSSSSTKYRMKRTGDHYYCTCPGWRNQGGVPTNGRTCKHLKELLGEEYERARCNLANPSAATSAPASKTTKKRKSKDDDDDEEDDAQPTTKKAKKVAAVPPKLLLANKWEVESKVDPTGWWISEKLDGVRCLWDPSTKQFLSRLGNPFTPPPWFTAHLPTHMSLDGELFSGRGQFSSTVSVVKTTNSKQWNKIRFHVFDAPSLSEKGVTFEERMDKIRKWLKGHEEKDKLDEIVVVVEQTKCKDKQHVLEMLKDVEKKGGEGLMLRKPGSLYEHGRGKTLLKVKSFYDAEAVVVGYEPGKGKHKGATGALRCKMESGKLFNVGTGLSDAERRKPPKIGAIITYRFQELTPDGVPRFPSYVGVRIDMDKPKDYVFPKKDSDS